MTLKNLQAENAELRLRLEEAEETTRAIQGGAIDAIVVGGEAGHRVYTLESVDRPYRLFVEQMQQGAATLLADGTLVYCNRQLADMLGVPIEKMLGTVLRDFVAAQDLVVYDQLREQADTRSGQGEVRLRRRDGASIPAYLAFSELPKDCGALIGVLVTDLTTQKHHQQLMLALQALRDSEERLKEGDRRKDEFLAVLAHELRNPLAPIRNALNILQITTHNDTDVVGIREMLERQVNQMVRLVDDLMEVSRITRGNIELRMEPVEVATIMRSAVETSLPLIDAAEHELDLAVPHEVLIVDGDPVRLAQILANLLNNAAKYTEPGGQIQFSGSREDDGVCIRVRDTGVGIAADMLPRVFDLFTQGDRGTDRAQGGLGIGLALVKSLVEMHGGSVKVRSEGVGRGSEFVVRLPLSLKHPDHQGPLASTHTAPVPRRRFLVVDDNQDSADSLGMLLELVGVDVRVAYTGIDALATFVAYRPAVVVLDIGMPTMDGHEVAPQDSGVTGSP